MPLLLPLVPLLSVLSPARFICCAAQLPTPFDTEEVRGDMLLVRMDKDSEPQNLTAAEWTAFERSGGSEVTGNGAANGDGADAAQPKHKKQRRR